MITNRITILLATLVSLGGTCTAGQALAFNCEQLAQAKLPATTIALAQSIPANSFTPPLVRATQSRKPVPVAFCRVSGAIRPTKDSDIKFEIWLPSDWTGRYQQVGNGGLAGQIRFDEMVSPLLAGSAVASTDDGHVTKPDAPIESNSEWAFGHPEKIFDYFQRSVHLTAQIGKAITQAYYGASPRFSYFNGCSKGGQEGLMEAQRYPNDFDGIVAGAPFNQVIKLWATDALQAKLLMRSKAGFISPENASKITQAITKVCGSQSGINDGWVNDPRQCKIRVDRGSFPFLTPAQLNTLANLYNGFKSTSGQRFPGIPFSSEVEWSKMYGETSFVSEDNLEKSSKLKSFDFYVTLLYQDRTRGLRAFNLDRALVDLAKMGEIANSDDADLTAFRARGGKLIMYQGWLDANLALETVDYYSRIIAAQRSFGSNIKRDRAQEGDALRKTQEFSRLFMVPGMGHCWGGPGPNSFGQRGGDGDADHDVVVAMQHWVEKGQAPARIIATKYIDSDNRKNTEMARPLCPYPQVTKFRGAGDARDANNFVCASPETRQK